MQRCNKTLMIRYGQRFHLNIHIYDINEIMEYSYQKPNKNTRKFVSNHQPRY